MCHGRGLNNKIKNIHERALRKKIQFRNFIKTWELIAEDNSKHMLFKFFRISQFTHCSRVWMFHGRCLNCKIKNIQESIKDSLQRHKIQFRNFIKTWQMIAEDN